MQKHFYFIDQINSTLLMNTVHLASFELLHSYITSMTLVSLCIRETHLPIHPCNTCVPKSLLPLHSYAFIIISATSAAFYLPILLCSKICAFKNAM